MWFLRSHLVLALQKLNADSTDGQQANVSKLCVQLSKCLASFCQLQEHYMPEVIPLVTTEAHTPSDSCNSPESASLFMPSALSRSLAHSTSLLTELAEMETQLQFSQMTDALSDL